MKKRCYYFWNSFTVASGSIFLLSVGMVLGIRQPWTILIISACTLAYVATAKVCRGHENMWIFVLLGIGAFPYNLFILYLLRDSFAFFSSGPISKIAVMALFLFILFSLEEIVVGLIGRKVWPIQKDDERDEED